MTVIRAPLRFYGSKFAIAPWIIQHFPAHTSYLEPCGGGASVLLRKEKCQIETYNELNGELVNFFRTVRSDPAMLAAMVEYTPWSRKEFHDAINPDDKIPPSQLERARRIVVSHYMSFHGGSSPSPSDFKTTTKGDKRQVNEMKNNIFPNMVAISDRLRHVQIENMDALAVIKKYDNPDCVIYFDPPYIPSTRTRLDGYYREPDVQWHVEAAVLLNEVEGMAVVSGYACDVYTEVYEDKGWERIDRKVGANSGATRTESLWLSPRTQARLKLPKQHSLI